MTPPKSASSEALSILQDAVSARRASRRLPAEFSDDARHVAGVLQIQIDADVLVRGVRLAVGMPEAGGGNRQSQVVDERVDGSRATSHWHEQHRLIEYVFRRPRH